MRLATVLILLMVSATALAADLGTMAPAKPVSHSPVAPADPAVLRQGGDTIADAVPIPIPYEGTGTTTGFVDDYDEVCPYTSSASPDVVYSMTPETDMQVDIDMLGSAYDTKIYVYDQDLNLLDCNDDFHPDYTSKLEGLPLQGGGLYYLVVDGYGSSFGDYLVTITEFEPCTIDCLPGDELENEPALVDDYEDLWNGGCNTEGITPFQSITTPLFCGKTGYFSNNGSPSRDTDWFHLTIPYAGYLEVLGDAEEACFMFELGPQDCDSVAVLQQVTIGPCNPQMLVITGEPGSLVWFWVGPTNFWDGETYEFNYVLEINYWISSMENHSLSAVKGLFR